MQAVEPMKIQYGSSKVLEHIRQQEYIRYQIMVVITFHAANAEFGPYLLSADIVLLLQRLVTETVIE